MLLSYLVNVSANICLKTYTIHDKMPLSELNKGGSSMEHKKATIYDIAKEAGVSAATVTRVINHSPSVREATRQKVQQVIDARGYMPSSLAQDLGTGSARIIGIILPSIRNPYYADLVSAADDEAREHGYSLWIYQMPRRGEITSAVIDRLIARRLSGAFFIGGFYDVDRPDLRELLARLGKYMPVVAICPPRENLGFVCMYNDLDHAVRQAVRHLHLLGHRKIAMIGGASRPEDSGQRAVSFLDELEKLGLPAPPDFPRQGGGEAVTGEHDVLSLLTAVPPEDRPTALFCYNDLTALGAMRQLRRMGYSLPEDMALIGCDNQFFCPYLWPSLTSIDMQPEEHARSAVRELLSASENHSAAIIRDATLIVRESCGVSLGWRKL